MKTLFRFACLAGLIVVGFWAWTIFFPSPQKVIEGRLRKAARLVSFAPDQGNIARIANIEQLGNLLAENVEVTVDVPGWERHSFSQRAELTQAIFGVRSVIRGLKVELPDISVSVAPDKQSAVANATVKVIVAGDKDLNIQELKFNLKLINGSWLITGVENLKLLQ